MNLLSCYGGVVYCDKRGTPHTYNKTICRYLNLADNIIWALKTQVIADNTAEDIPALDDRIELCALKRSIGFNTIFSDLFYNLNVLKQKSNEADMLIARLPSLSGTVASFYFKKNHKPYFVEMVGCPWDSYWNHSFKGKIVAPIMWFLTRVATKNASYVAYVSESFLQKRYPTNGKVIACSDVQIKKTSESVLNERLEKIQNMKRPVVLGTVAGIDVRYKGQQYVIKAIAKLKKEGYCFKYRLVGTGSGKYLKKVAEKYNVSDCVEFCGALPHDEIFEFMDDIDIYIQPSLTEGLPRTVVEAMSRACPVTGANTGGIPELVNPDYLFKRKSVNAICKTLKLLYNEKVLKEEAERSFKRAKDFDSGKLQKIREDFYRKYKAECEK